MASSGPKTRRKAKPTNIPTTTSIIQPETLSVVKIPASVMIETNTLEAFTLELIDIAKNNNPRERMLNAESFFAKHKEYIEKSAEKIVNMVGFHFLKHEIPYAYTESQLTASQQKLSASRNAGDQNQIAFIEERIAQIYKASETLLLLGDNKVNVWHILLTHPKTQELRKIMLHYLFQDLCPSTSILIQRFISGNLNEHYYHIYYELLLEKIELLEQYADEYQDHLCAKLEEVSSGISQDFEGLKNDIQSLLNAYHSASLFLSLFYKKDQAQRFNFRVQTFIDKLLPVCAKANILPESLSRLKINYSKEKIEDFIKDQMLKNYEVSLGIFITLDGFYKTIWQQTTHPLNLNIDLTLLEQDAKDTKLILDNMENTFIIPGLVTMQIQCVLTTLGNYKTVPTHQLTNEVVSSVLHLVVALMVMLRKDLLNNALFHRISLGVLKQIVDDLKKTKLSADKEVETMIADINHLNLDPPMLVLTPSSSHVQTPQISSPSASSAQGPSAPEVELEQQEQAKLDSHAQRLRQQMTQVVTQDYEEQLKKEKAEKIEAYDAKLQELKAQIEREKEKLAKRLQEEKTAKLAELEKKYSSDFSVEKEKHEENLTKYREKKERQLNTKKAELLAEHQKKMTQLEEQQKGERQRLHVENQSALDTQHLQYQSELTISRDQYQTKVSELKAKHRVEVEKLIADHQVTLTQQKNVHQAKLKKLVEQQRSELNNIAEQHQAELSQLQNKLFGEHQVQEEMLKVQIQQVRVALEAKHKQEIDKLQHESRLKSPFLKAIHLYAPIRQIELPPMMSFSNDLEGCQLEFYFVGGWVRNRLMGMPIMPNEDIDIIVNCNSTELPETLKNQCWQNPNQSKHFKLGKIDLWCEKWVELREFLSKKDFSINTFISTQHGVVYDLLGVRKDLSAPYLTLLGNPRERFVEDPSLIMRMLRFSNQLQKDIQSCDVDLIKEHAARIRYLPIGVYLNNLQKLFLSPFAKINFSTILRYGLLSELFPTLPAQLPMFCQFWDYKLNDFSYYFERYDYYHVLALFLMMPLVMKNPKQEELADRLSQCVEAFFDNYKGEINEADKQKIRKTIGSIILEEDGLFAQFQNYTQLLAAPDVMGEPRTFIQNYQNGRRPNGHQKQQNTNVKRSDFSKKR